MKTKIIRGLMLLCNIFQEIFEQGNQGGDRK